jgi:hypothetical protein
MLLEVMLLKLKQLFVVTPLYLLKQRFLELEEQRQLERLSPSQRLDPEVALRLKEEHSSRLELFLRQQLRRTPVWVRGHLALSRLQIASKQYSAAILSAMAVKQLCNGAQGIGSCKAKKFTEADIILGLCYNRLRAFKLALKHLGAAHQAISTGAPTTVKLPTRLKTELLEELAAAYLGDNMKREAHEALLKIPADARTSSVEAMLRFLRDTIGGAS